jgi:hypothetical protein
MLEPWRAHPDFAHFEKAILCNPEEKKAAKKMADELAKMAVGSRPAVMAEAMAICLYGTLGGLILSGVDSRRSSEYVLMMVSWLHDRLCNLIDRARHSPAGHA